MWNPEKWELPKIKPRGWNVYRWIYEKQGLYHMSKLERLKEYDAKNDYQMIRHRLRAQRLEYAENMLSFFIDYLIRRNVKAY